MPLLLKNNRNNKKRLMRKQVLPTNHDYAEIFVYQAPKRTQRRKKIKNNKNCIFY